MQLFEFLFFLLLAVVLLRHIFGDNLPIKSEYLVSIGILLLIASIVMHGYRWQMIPAYLSFGLLALLLIKFGEVNPIWRLFYALPLTTFLFSSAFLTYQLPVLKLSEPRGPYGVGTFDYTTTDESRRERFAPDHLREIYVRVWYPSNKLLVNDFPARSLWQELYDGKFDEVNFLSSYLKKVDTHSHQESPLADGGPFQVLLFNTGFAVWPEANTMLMEHLASHGYVILSVGHPYENRLNLPDQGTLSVSRTVPDDVTLGIAKSPEFGYFASGGARVNAGASLIDRKYMFRYVNELVDRFSLAPDLSSRKAIVKNAILDGQLKLTEHSTEDSINNFLMARMHMNLSTKTWVEHTQFVIDNISHLIAPIENFSSSLVINNLGVFGFSFGGSVAGEFCKMDSRCRAGANLDGIPWGMHWDKPMKAPFLRLHQDYERTENEFAYAQTSYEFIDYTIKNTTHAEFMDLPYFAPLLRTLGISGDIDGTRIGEILNDVILDFFNRRLRGKAGSLNLDEYPEISSYEPLTLERKTARQIDPGI